MASPIRQRIQVHQDWAGDIPLKNLWGVYFYPRAGVASMTGIGENIRQTIADYQPGAYQVETDLLERFTSDDQGYLLAQAVAMPRESVRIDTTDIPNAGGFIGGYYGQTREKYGASNKLDITFLETNTDILDFYIKPWIVATSFKGLIEDDSELDTKCNISIVQYSRTNAFYGDKWGSSQNPRRGFFDYSVRKQTNFFNCAPISMDADKISYGEITESDIVRPVAWTFSDYNINIPERGV